MKAHLKLSPDRTVARVFLASKGNVIDAKMIMDLDAILQSIEQEQNLAAIVIAGEGPNFSYGASVEEHLPEQIAETLARLGGLLRRVAAAPAPTIAAVHGHCLGGGFELALACDIIIAEENAQLGLPEIGLGVFPPAGSVLLPIRAGAAVASAMVLTGESWTGTHALQQGVVARVTPPGGLLMEVDAYIREHFAGRSAAALRHATRVVRRDVVKALHEELPKLDRLYLEELMREPDAVEGILAFLERRQPKWMRKEVVV